MVYNNTSFYYVRDILANIIGIVDNNGKFVVKYTYDAFGKILTTTSDLKDTLGKDNPFIYKGYYYDYETSLYYCNSRYYVPELGRWLNADDVSYLDLSSVNGLNLYAYYENNPIHRYDPSGHSWKSF